MSEPDDPPMCRVPSCRYDSDPRDPDGLCQHCRREAEMDHISCGTCGGSGGDTGALRCPSCRGSGRRKDREVYDGY